MDKRVISSKELLYFSKIEKQYLKWYRALVRKFEEGYLVEWGDQVLDTECMAYPRNPFVIDNRAPAPNQNALAPLRRALSDADAAFVERAGFNIKEFRHGRQKLFLECLEDLYTLRMTCCAEILQEMRESHNWKILRFLEFAAETRRSLFQMRVAAFYYSLGLRRAERIANDAIDQFERLLGPRLLTPQPE